MEHSNPENIWFTIFSSCFFMVVLLEAHLGPQVWVFTYVCSYLFQIQTIFWKGIIHRQMKEHCPSKKSGSKPEVHTGCHIGLKQNVERVFSKFWQSPSWKVMGNKKDPSFAASLNPELYIKQMSSLQYAMCRQRNSISQWHLRVTLLWNASFYLCIHKIMCAHTHAVYMA